MNATDGTATPLLAIEGVEAAYGDSMALFGLSMEVGVGEVTTLLGRNGMGKTTAVRAIMGLLPVTAGRILFQGRAIN